MSRHPGFPDRPPLESTIYRGPVDKSPVDESELSEARKQLATFRRRLEDKADVFNVFVEWEKVLNLTALEMSSVAYVSLSRYYGWRQGLLASVPNSILDTAEKLLGPGGAGLFEAAWQRFRERLPAEVKEKLRKRYFPTGNESQWAAE